MEKMRKCSEYLRAGRNWKIFSMWIYVSISGSNGSSGSISNITKKTRGIDG